MVLQQNTDRQAAVIRTLAAAHINYGGSLSQLKADGASMRKIQGEIANAIAMMPLWKLQRVGDEVVDFLYANDGKGRSIALKPGVAFCFRRFYPLVRNLIEGAWANYIRSQNVAVLGHTSDLGAFLFGSERADLEAYRPLVREIQEDMCLYCGQAVRDKGEIDHFIPWSKYPADLGQNMVLSHRTCNASKSDLLAAERHLEGGQGVPAVGRYIPFYAARQIEILHISQ